jgi:hypothetical protein
MFQLDLEHSGVDVERGGKSGGGGDGGGFHVFRS